MSFVPNELWCTVLSHVTDVRTKIRARRVCRQLRTCVDDSAAWRHVAYVSITVTSLGRLAYTLSQRRTTSSVTIDTVNGRLTDAHRLERNEQILAYLLPRLAVYVDALKITLNVTDAFPNALVAQMWTHLLVHVTNWAYRSIVFEYRQMENSALPHAQPTIEHFRGVLTCRRHSSMRPKLDECIVDVQCA